MGKLLRIILLAFFAQLLHTHSVWSDGSVPVRVVLDNGMVVILLENRNAPVATIHAWVGAGSVTEGEFTGSGISHFVEHMLFKGTERRSVGQLGQEVKESGGKTNAYTSYDKTVYYITCHSDYFDKALDIMADALMHSVFDPAEAEREREVIIKEIKMSRDHPFRRLYLMAHQTAYAVHPYRNPVIGYESLLGRLTRDDLLTYYRRLYVPNNIALVAVGDFDSSEALPKIREAFRDFKRGSIAPMVVPQEPRQKRPRERVEEFGVTVAQSMMGFHGPNLHSQDMYPMDVLAIVLGGGDTSRLYRELREKKGIVYDINAWSATPRDPGMFWINCSFEPENYGAVKDAIWEQIEKLTVEDVSEEELETARAKVLSDYLFSRESVEGQARSLGSGELDAQDMEFDKQYVESIARVTAQDIREVIEKYFRPDNSVIATLMPVGEKMPREDSAEDYEEKAAAQRIEKEVLQNGLTLLLREDHSIETVSIRLLVRGGAKAESKSNTGITNLMSKAMLKGTATSSAEEIASAIEARGGRIRSFTGHNSFGFELDMLSREVETGLTLLADVIANPSFPTEEVEREKAAALASIKSVDDQIFSSSMKLFRETMFNDHPYSFLIQGEAEVVDSMTPDDLREFHSQAVAASGMVLSVFGDINKAEVAAIVEREFGQLGSSNRVLTGWDSESFASEVKTAEKSLNKEQLAMLVGFPGVTVRDPDRYPLEVLASSLNSQGGKLFQTLRDERGLAYSVGAFNILGVDPGAFVLYIITVPQKREEAISGMFEVIRELREEGLDAEELERTKVEVMGKHAIGLQTNGQIASEASFDELYGMGYDNYERYDPRIRAITAEDIRRVASQIFDLNRYVLVAVGDLESE
ncbi:MAG: insulinase family protein [Candidatus Hydrogenedentota bacterium]|nr:MAG: insulinase family protein [Candidatus Hydrogenedentota bacterium]